VDAVLMDGWQQRMAAWEAARLKRRQVREELARARRFGLAARHAAKMARIHAACTVAEDGTIHCVDRPPFDVLCPLRPPVTAPTPARRRRPGR
jgi:hypothetical protein